MNEKRVNRFHRRICKVEEAQNRLLSCVNLLEAEMVPLQSSLGRRLAETVAASCDVPHFPRASMDGYAVRSEDVGTAKPGQPVVLKVVSSIAAGGVERCSITLGEAVRVMTGAPVPVGADTVVMLEQTEAYEESGQTYVKITHSLPLGKNVAAIGEEISRGVPLIENGSCIQPGQIALLATCGHDMVSVYRKPKVAILATGSELIQVDQPLAYGKIRNSNGFMIAAQTEMCGGEVLLCSSIPDEWEKTKAFINHAVQEADLVVSTGGVSVGDFDLLADYFLEREENLLFSKVAMRPGGPTSAAVQDGKLIVGLSGNPGACFVGFELFVRPLLLAMQGVRHPIASAWSAILDEDMLQAAPHDKYERARYFIENGRIFVRPLRRNKSSMMASIQEANCLLKVPAGKAGVSKGDVVTIFPLMYEPIPL